MATEAKNRYVLIIEDSKEDSGPVCSFLDKRGLSYKLAADSAQALQTAQAFPPVAIILDIMLPGINGFKLAQLFKTDVLLKEVPIIVLSVLTNAQDKELAKRIGVNEYLTKPFDCDKLGAILKKYGV